MCILTNFCNVLLMFWFLLQSCFESGARFWKAHVLLPFFKLVPPVLLPRLHVTRPRRCKPSTVGRRQKPQLFYAIFTRFSPLGAPQVTCHQASPLQAIYGRETPKTTAISPVFPPWEPHRLHVIRLRRCKPSTVGRRQKPQLFSPVFPPWELHRLHVIRPHRCKPSTVGRRQKPQLLIFTRFSPLGAPQVTCHQASPLQTIYGRETPKTTAIFTRFSPLGAPQVTCHQASPLQTIYGRETPKTTAIFTRFSPFGAPQVTCHQASPLQTIYTFLQRARVRWWEMTHRMKSQRSNTDGKES